MLGPGCGGRALNNSLGNTAPPLAREAARRRWPLPLDYAVLRNTRSSVSSGWSHIGK